jgi:hypothetical protein
MKTEQKPGSSSFEGTKRTSSWNKKQGFPRTISRLIFKEELTQFTEIEISPKV